LSVYNNIHCTEIADMVGSYMRSLIMNSLLAWMGRSLIANGVTIHRNPMPISNLWYTLLQWPFQLVAAHVQASVSLLGFLQVA